MYSTREDREQAAKLSESQQRKLNERRAIFYAGWDGRSVSVVKAMLPLVVVNAMLGAFPHEQPSPISGGSYELAREEAFQRFERKRIEAETAVLRQVAP
jgi:hypothetical protein